MLQYVNDIKLLIVEDGYLDLSDIRKKKPDNCKFIHAYTKIIPNRGRISIDVVDVPATCRRLINSYLKDYFVFEDLETNNLYIAIKEIL